MTQQPEALRLAGEFERDKWHVPAVVMQAAADELRCLHAENAALAAALAQQEEQVEPVAWMYTGIKQDGTEHGPHLVWKPKYMDAMSASKGAKATPLYAAPPQRKPLTQEEIDHICASLGFAAISPVEITRAVEQAHGIGEQP